MFWENFEVQFCTWYFCRWLGLPDLKDLCFFFFIGFCPKIKFRNVHKMGHFRNFLKMYTKWGIFENFRKCTRNGAISKFFENVHQMGHFRKCTQNGEFSKMYTKCYAHNCLIFSCKCHIFCFFIGIKFNIDKVAPTRNNLKTLKISQRFEVIYFFVLYLSVKFVKQCSDNTKAYKKLSSNWSTVFLLMRQILS